MKTKELIFLVPAMFIIGLGFGIRLQRKTHHCTIDCLPSIVEVQVRLNEEGYDLRLDGVAGPNTLKAWREKSEDWERRNEREFILAEEREMLK